MEGSMDNSFDWGSFLGNIGGSTISTAGSLYANAQNERFAREMFDKQVQLANTAHQREVKDLRAAGLNPILSASGGSGAESPSAQNLKIAENPLANWATVASTAAQLKNAEAAKTAADTQAWQVYDAKDLGKAGFEVLGFGGNGRLERVQTVRINKVTGDCYTLDGRKVRIVGSKDVSSSHDVPGGEVDVYQGPASFGREWSKEEKAKAWKKLGHADFAPFVN